MRTLLILLTMEALHHLDLQRRFLHHVCLLTKHNAIAIILAVRLILELAALTLLQLLPAISEDLMATILVHLLIHIIFHM